MPHHVLLPDTDAPNTPLFSSISVLVLSVFAPIFQTRVSCSSDYAEWWLQYCGIYLTCWPFYPLLIGDLWKEWRQLWQAVMILFHWDGWRTQTILLCDWTWPSLNYLNHWNVIDYGGTPSLYGYCNILFAPMVDFCRQMENFKAMFCALWTDSIFFRRLPTILLCATACFVGTLLYVCGYMFLVYMCATCWLVS